MPLLCQAQCLLRLVARADLHLVQNGYNALVSASRRVYQAMMEATASSSTVQQQIERNYRWNFLVNSLDGATFWFGMSFISSTVILPLYVSHFTTNPLLIGLIPFLATAG